MSSTMFKKLYVSSQTLFLVFSFLSLNFSVQAADMGIPVQLRLRAPDLSYPSEAGVDIYLYVLSNNSCVLRLEKFTNQTVTDGFVSLSLGAGTLQPAGGDPNLTLNQVYDNTVAKTNLKCVDADNNIIATGQTYTPAATDGRILRVSTNILATGIIANFNMKSAPYAIQAESVGGKVASDILVKNAGTQLSQANLEALLLDNTRLTNLLNLATNGQALSAVSATNAVNATNADAAVNFTANLSGDITGTQSATVVSKLRGVNLSATVPTVGQVLAYDGSQYVPTTPAAATVLSVNGKTGAVVLTGADISGVVTSTTSILGDVTGNVSATVVTSVGGKSAAAIATTVNDVSSATSNATPSTLVMRDGSGNISANTVSALSTSVQNVNIYESTNTNYVRIKAANSFSNYILTLPVDDGTSGQMLVTDGSGNLSWAAPGGISSATIISALGYTPADNAQVALKANNLSDLASATVARANLGLAGAAVLNVGTTVGTVAAGDDSRISGALQQTSFNAYVASASCAVGQSLYWNSVSSTFLCQNISVSGDISGTVSSVTVTRVQGVGVSFAALANNHLLQYNGTDFVNRAIPTCSAGEYLTFNGTTWSCAVDAGSAGIIASLSVTAPISSTGGVNPILSMSQASSSANGYLTSSDWAMFNNKMAATSAAVISALGYTPASSTALGNYALKSNNLSDLASASAARTNLGLGGAAELNVGTTAGTVAAGDDSRITNALSTSTNFSGDLSGTYNSLVLANSGVAAGTYATVTVDTKGRVTSGHVMSGDATLANTGVLTLKNTGTAGSYGAGDKSLVVTTDAQGRVTSVGENSIAIVSSQVTNFASTVLATALTGFSAATATAVTAADTVLAAIGKLQGQLNTILNPATTMVSASGNITTTSTTDVAMTGMSITPPAGTYQVNFTTSVSHGSNGASINMQLYAGGAALANSQTQTVPRVAVGLNYAALTLNQTVLGEVTVNGSQAIEIRWNTSAGTATSVGTRMMIVRRVR